MLVVILSCIIAVAAGQCTGNIPAGLRPGHEATRYFRARDTDLRLGDYRREYRIILPHNYSGREKLPVLMYFHGWGDNYTCIDDQCSLAQKGSRHGFIVVKPKGMSDGGPSSWNLGTANHTDTCNHTDVDKYNYRSCAKTGVTSICNCGTCYDDLSFVAQLLETLASEICIDVDRIYASGTSFGALFNYYTAPALATHHSGKSTRHPRILFRAILPWYGAFYRHTEVIAERSTGPSVFHFHGLRDTEVPPGGGESADGYLYIPVEKTLTAYAQAYGCDAQASNLSTPFDGKGTLLGCKEWRHCKNDLRVVRCNWDEEHGFWPNYAVEMMLWFISSVSTGILPDELRV